MEPISRNMMLLCVSGYEDFSRYKVDNRANENYYLADYEFDR